MNQAIGFQITLLLSSVQFSPSALTSHSLLVHSSDLAVLHVSVSVPENKA